LTHLHGQTPPIVHRDIKPQNILVQSRDPLHIKLADFGLSKASDDLSTLCGTHTYLAPEIALYYQSSSAQAVKYKNAVDIWSLGVVIFEYACGLPDPGSSMGLPWCEKIISALDDWDSDRLVDLLSTMIVMDPKLRASARECLRRASQLRVPGRCLTPKPASCGLRQDQTEDDNGSTTIILGNLWGTQGTSYLDKSKVSPVGIKRQRSPAVGFTNTSFSRGRSKRQHHNGLSKQSSGSRIFDADAPLGDDTTEVAKVAGMGIATLDTNTSRERSVDNSDASNGPPILITGLQGSGDIGGRESGNSPSGLSTPFTRSDSRLLKRRTSHASSWSLTIGARNSDSGSGYEVATGLFIRKDHFSPSLLSRFTADDQAEDANSHVRHGSPALPKPEEAITGHPALASFEQRVLQLLA
jgi:serine/threonine protein kinase